MKILIAIWTMTLAYVGILVLFGWRKLFRGGWRFASIRDVANILLASWIFLLVMYVLGLLFVHIPAWLDRKPILIMILKPVQE